MRDGDVLTVVKTTEQTVCPIGKFSPKPPPPLELEPAPEIISQRKFAELVGVTQASIWQAIQEGRITAVVKGKQGTQLYKEAALAQWNATRVAANNNRAGELKADKVKDALFDDGDQTPGQLKTTYEAELARLKCDELRQKIAVRDGELHDGEQIKALWNAVLSNFRSRMRSLPSNLAPKIAAIPNLTPGLVQEMMLDAIDEVLSELATGKFLTENNDADTSDFDDD